MKKKTTHDGLTVTLSMRKGVYRGGLYFDSADLGYLGDIEKYHIYYLLKVTDKYGNPVSGKQIKLCVDAITFHTVSDYNGFEPVINYSGDLKQSNPEVSVWTNVNIDSNGEYLAGLLPCLIKKGNSQTKRNTVGPYTYAVVELVFIVDDVDIRAVMNIDDTFEPLNLSPLYDYPVVTNSTGNYRDITDTVIYYPSVYDLEYPQLSKKVYFGFREDAIYIHEAKDLVGVSVDENNRAKMPFTESEINNRAVLAYGANTSGFLSAPLRCREANSQPKSEIIISPQNNSNIFPGQTVYATFQYQLKTGESFSGTECPFKLNRGNFYPPDISWWQDGNTLYGGCLLTVNDSLKKGDQLSWTVSCCLDNSGIPLASETVTWNVAWDADIDVDVTFAADTPVLIDYSNDSTRPLSSRPTMTWRLTVPGLRNTQACFYPLVTRITEDAIISDASFSEIVPCAADRTSGDYFYVMLDDLGSAVINVQPRENRTLLTAFSAGIYGVGTMVNTANFFINSAWEAATAPAVSVAEGQNPQARPGDDSYGLATFPLLSNWEAVKEHDLLGGAVYLFAGKEIQKKNHYTPLTLLGKTQIPLKASGGAPDIALYFTESNFEAGKTYYIHACLVENAYLHKGVNYLRLQEIKFEIPQDQPAAPDGVKRTYRAPEFVCKDGAVIDEDDVLLGRNEIGYQGLEYRIPLSGGQKHLVAGDQIMATAYLHAWNKQTQEMENSNPLLKLNQPHTVTDADINRGYLTDVISIDDLAGCDMPPQGVDQSTLRVEYYCQNKQEYSYLREVFIDMYP
ncbi:hypothetical protein CQJ28_24125 [Escherichia sp. E2562]|uniref:hypothetical protein n=1 Tax=Escherichia sp. E2562 TaxID=2041646 RepID=UPI00107EF7A9|nr:hypothetical protein [Escherichia sp. E2562]TGC12835.1 hypothetical protein CQJ28_24125 [Escherichia sp. E2562]